MGFGLTSIVSLESISISETIDICLIAGNRFKREIEAAPSTSKTYKNLSSRF
jgi:hypothetical protein